LFPATWPRRVFCSALACPSPASSSQTGRSAGRWCPRASRERLARPRAGFRTRSAFRIASRKRPFRHERDSHRPVTEPVTRVKRNVALSVTPTCGHFSIQQAASMNAAICGSCDYCRRQNPGGLRSFGLNIEPYPRGLRCAAPPDKAISDGSFSAVAARTPRRAVRLRA